MDIKEMIAEKDRIGMSYEKLSHYTGISVGALHKIFSGQTKNPRKDTLRAIERIFTGESKEEYASKHAWMNAPLFPADIGNVSVLRETPVANGSSALKDRYTESTVPESYATGSNAPESNTDFYHSNAKGRHTLDDYYRLPSERRVELIDGTFFEMEAPNSLHQEIISILQYHFTDYVRKNKGTCKVYGSPIDVQLDQDDRTMVQPDLLVVCNRDKISRFGIYGAPDFCLEVVSPSSGKKDVLLKNYKYANAGVREYWIILPKEKKLLVYNYEKDTLTPEIYSLHGTKGVGIWDNQLEIDLSEIAEAILEFEKLKESDTYRICQELAFI